MLGAKGEVREEGHVVPGSGNPPAFPLFVIHLSRDEKSLDYYVLSTASLTGDTQLSYSVELKHDSCPRLP